jgi:preprotein translocase subunit SecB
MMIWPPWTGQASWTACSETDFFKPYGYLGSHMTEPQPVFNIEKIYVKDVSLEVPHAPHIFLERETPEIGVQLNTHNQAIDANEGIQEVVLTVTVTAKLKDKTLFLVEVTQAGVFRIKHIPEGDLNKVLEIGCPNILFPFVRETVSDMVTRAGFPQVLLNPINFEALYEQRASRQKDAAAAG